MLVKPIYEALPYAYIAAGSSVLVTQNSALAWLAGLLLYAAGAMIWLLRANYRCQPRNRQKALRLPTRFYEVAPFVYILLGLICTLISNQLDAGHLQPLTTTAATLFYGAGFGSWLMRIRYRGYHSAAPATSRAR